MASIVETIAGDRRVRLGAESFARKLTFGNDWNRLKILFRISCADSGASITTTGLTVGVSSGATEGFASSNLVAFAGAQLGGGSGYDVGTWTRGTYGSVGLSYRVAGISAVYKYGSTVVAGTNNGSSSAYMPFNTSGNYGAFYCVVTRTPGLFTLGAGGYDLSTYTTTSMDVFNLGTDNNSISMWAWYGDATVSYTGTLDFDSVMIRWNKASPALEISNLRVVRYY